MSCSPVTIANAFYVGRRSVETVAARVWVCECLDAFEIVPLDLAILKAADQLPGSDFEDGIQIASADNAGVDAIVTLRSKGLRRFLRPCPPPAELLALLPKDYHA